MGILDYEKKITTKTSTKGFYFGAPEAEAENVNGYKLTDYFEDYLDILDNLSVGKFIFVGRKGVGKSAITKFIKDKSDSSDDSFATILRLSDFEIEKVIQESSIIENKETILFEWLILVSTVKLILKNNCGTYTKEFEKLQKFIDNNAGIVNIDKFQIEEGFNKTGGEVSFGVLTHAFGGVIKKYFDVKVTKAPFYKLISPLKDIIKIILDYPINKESEFWLLFDDLDVNFNIYSENDKLKIMELIRISRIYNNEVFLNNRTKILIFIREDVRSKIIAEYPDSAKIFNSYEIPITWYKHDELLCDESKTAIKRMINKRIEINFKKRNIPFGTDPWYSLFSNEISSQYSYARKSSFKYILDFTFYRPRDIITILNVVSDSAYSYPISQQDIKKILEKYINKNIDEIKSELSLLFTEIDKEKIFRELFKYASEAPIKTYNQILTKIRSLNFSISPELVIEYLISYSFFVPSTNTGDLLFSYRESVDLDKIKREDLNINLPKNIYHYYRPIN